MLKCQFCGRECKNLNSLRNHERLCSLNPNRQFTKFSDPNFQKIKNGNGGTNQYIKARELGIPDPIVLDETKKKISDSVRNRDADYRKKLSASVTKTVNKRVLEGTWHTSLARKMHYTYKGIDLHGKWELAFARFLDVHNIKWIRCKEHFSYVFEGIERRYTPDFYLPETDEYVEIKGFRTKKDIAKWQYFPKNKILTVYYGKHLKELGLDV